MLYRCVFAIFVILLLSCSYEASEAADAVTPTAATHGVVVSVVGNVVVERSGIRASVLEGFVLMGGDMIVLQDGAQCTGFTPQGEIFTLTGPAELQLPGLSDDGVVDDIATWVRRQLADWIGEGRRRPLTTRSAREWAVAKDAPALVIPAPDGSVRAGRSGLYWTTVPGVDRYRVTVAPDVGEELTRVVRGNTMALEELAPGAEYVWKVGVDLEGWSGQSGWRTFRVLTAEEESELGKALSDLDNLEAGVLLLSIGLHDEAICHLDAAVEAGTSDRSARLWRAQALAECGLYREAYEDLIRLRGTE